MNKEIIAEARDKIQAWQAVNHNAPGLLEDKALDEIIQAAIEKAYDAGFAKGWGEGIWECESKGAARASESWTVRSDGNTFAVVRYPDTSDTLIDELTFERATEIMEKLSAAHARPKNVPPNKK